MRRPDGTVLALGQAVRAARPRSVRWAAVRLWAPRRKVRSGAGGWQADWDRALVVNLVGVQHGGRSDPWILATDLPPTVQRLGAYRSRMRIEELFRDLKHFGWNWQDSRVRQPGRVQRLLLALALATLWVLELGQLVRSRGLGRLVEDACRPCYSLFQLGLRFAQRCLTTDEPLPPHRRPLPIPAP